MNWLLARLLSPGVVRVLIYLTSPKFTAGSIVVWIDDGEVLLVRSTYGQRAWGFPGGVMSRHEDPIDCAVRELLEETGVVVAPEELVLVGSHTQRRARHIDHVFRLERPRQDDLAEVPDRLEVAEVKWWPLDALPELRHEADDAIDRYLP